MSSVGLYLLVHSNNFIEGTKAMIENNKAEKKAYSPIQISELGLVNELTQAMAMGNYADNFGGSMIMEGMGMGMGMGIG